MTRQEIFAYCLQEYGAEPEYLWASNPTYAVLRHAANRKWFAAVLDVPADRLGLPGSERLDILDIKCDGRMLGDLLSLPGYLPAYHMNKNCWITVLLDGSVPETQIRSLLDFSHQLTGPKRRPPAEKE